MITTAETSVKTEISIAKAMLIFYMELVNKRGEVDLDLMMVNGEAITADHMRGGESADMMTSSALMGRIENVGCLLIDG